MIPFAIAAIASEDDRALMTDIYLRHRALMLKVAWEYTREPSEVDDIVSESCVRLIQHLDGLKAMDLSGRRAYIVATVRHKAVDFCRRKNREQERTAHVDTEQLETPVSFERRIAVQEEIDMVKKALAALPERERETLTMKFFEQKEDREIAGLLNVSESTVRKYIMQGRNRIKAALYAEEETE